MRRALTTPLVTGLLVTGLAQTARAFEPPTVGGHEGEIDVGARFEGMFGQLEPSERPSTHQRADIKVFGLGAGVTFGDLGPFLDFRVGIEGGYLIAGAESVERPDDDPPVGFTFHPEDKAGWVTASVFSNLVHQPRLAFGAFLEGTFPVDMELEKFSNVRVHYAGGGTLLGIHLTDPEALARLTNTSRMFFGSGAYDGEGQHNAQVQLESLFYLDFDRWLLPWRAGVGVGPRFESDLNEHIDDAYHQAYGAITPDLVAAEKVRQLRLGAVARLYLFVTEQANLELEYDGQLSGVDARATQQFIGSLRAAF